MQALHVKCRNCIDQSGSVDLRPATKSRIRKVLRKHGPTSYGKLIGLLRNAPGISDLLQSMEQQGEVSKDSRGRYLSRNSASRVVPERSFMTGIATKESHRWFLQPLVQDGSKRIPLGSVSKLRDGDLVTVRLHDLSSKARKASVQRVIHTESESDRAALALLNAYEVPHEEGESTEHGSIPNRIESESLAGREDLRDLPFITIDGESAKDFDDAVLANLEKQGIWRLWVAIADVAHYVKPGDPLDARAQARGNSVYLSDRVVPMLPHELSSGICSLRPNEDRLVIVCDMSITQDGVVRSYSFYEAVIRSAARLTYTEAFQVCKGESSSRPSSVVHSLRELYEVSKILGKARELRGALDFTTRESSVLVENGDPVDVVLHDRNDAHSMIEEAMISANVCAARFLLEHDCPALFRVHEGPDSKSLSELRRNLTGCSLPPEKLSGEKPMFIKRLLDNIRSSTRTPWIWELLVLRSMKQAMYSFDNSGHFGLALENYVHFTSPIRRYSDLFVHRQIKKLLNGERESRTEIETSANLGNELSLCERRAVEVTRRVDSWLKCSLLKKETGKIFKGHIVKIEEFGLFVELDRYLISGLIHVSDLEDDYYENRVTELVGVATGKIYKIGESMKVRLTSVDVEQQRLDLVDANASEVGHEYRKGKLVFRRERRKRR
ncbi:MAG: VacB/RNase II family 3'-5' exoribonuclease [Gammaproteobacteria bacterium]|nr:VacB/RNase II family 3'-5' exoribonuclease [Gammaproteobacteria bacterium]MYD81110.1 VacB/RNase II family 3'-5' exoribonuclease [Gammaproteobacteria bacterium]